MSRQIFFWVSLNGYWLLFLLKNVIFFPANDQVRLRPTKNWGCNFILKYMYVCMLSQYVVSDSLWPHGLQPTRLLYRIFQARILGWDATAFSKRSSWLRDQTQCRPILHRRQILYHWAIREALDKYLVIWL